MPTHGIVGGGGTEAQARYGTGDGLGHTVGLGVGQGVGERQNK